MTLQEARDLVAVIHMTSDNETAAKYILGAFAGEMPVCGTCGGTGEILGDFGESLEVCPSCYPVNKGQ